MLTTRRGEQFSGGPPSNEHVNELRGLLKEQVNVTCTPEPPITPQTPSSGATTVAFTTHISTET